MAVGDGANDLLMLDIAGLGIAWNAKENVRELAPHVLNGEVGTGGLTDLRWVLGPEAEEE